MNVCCLFSNVGSHALGLALVGMRVVQFVEVNDQRRALLESRFPGVPTHSDVRTYHASPGSASVLIGGPPCQRTSKAAAIHGYRSGESLWPEMRRVGRELAPEWIIVEQPPGNEEWEAEVRDDLGADGFHSARAEFAACDLGAPHIRRRVFILAHACFARLALAWQEIPRAVAETARSAAAGNHWIAGPPRALRVADGPSEWLDRNAAVEAIGDSNPPQMVTAIGRAIVKTSPSTSTPKQASHNGGAEHG